MQINLRTIKRSLGKYFNLTGDREDELAVIEQVKGYGDDCGLHSLGLDFSPVTGTKGNIEYLLFMQKKLCDNEVSADRIRAVVEASHRELK